MKRAIVDPFPVAGKKPNLYSTLDEEFRAAMVTRIRPLLEQRFTKKKIKSQILATLQALYAGNILTVDTTLGDLLCVTDGLAASRFKIMMNKKSMATMVFEQITGYKLHRDAILMPGVDKAEGTILKSVADEVGGNKHLRRICSNWCEKTKSFVITMMKQTFDCFRRDHHTDERCMATVFEDIYMALNYSKNDLAGMCASSESPSVSSLTLLPLSSSPYGYKKPAIGEIVDFFDPFLGWGLGEIVEVDRDFIQVKYEVWYESKIEWVHYLEPRVHKEMTALLAIDKIPVYAKAEKKTDISGADTINILTRVPHEVLAELGLDSMDFGSGADWSEEEIHFMRYSELENIDKTGEVVEVCWKDECGNETQHGGLVYRDLKTGEQYIYYDDHSEVEPLSDVPHIDIIYTGRLETGPQGPPKAKLLELIGESYLHTKIMPALNEAEILHLPLDMVNVSRFDNGFYDTPTEDKNENVRVLLEINARRKYFGSDAAGIGIAALLARAKKPPTQFGLAEKYKNVGRQPFVELLLQGASEDDIKSVKGQFNVQNCTLAVFLRRIYRVFVRKSRSDSILAFMYHFELIFRGLDLEVVLSEAHSALEFLTILKSAIQMYVPSEYSSKQMSRSVSEKITVYDEIIPAFGLQALNIILPASKFAINRGFERGTEVDYSAIPISCRPQHLSLWECLLQSLSAYLEARDHKAEQLVAGLKSIVAMYTDQYGYTPSPAKYKEWVTWLDTRQISSLTGDDIIKKLSKDRDA